MSSFGRKMDATVHTSTNIIVTHITDGNSIESEVTDIMGGEIYELSSDRIKREVREECEQIIAEKDRSIAERDKSIREKDKSIREKDKSLKEKDAEIAALKAQLAALTG